MAEKRGSAAEQVKALVEAAERIRAEAERDASAVREAAGRVVDCAEEVDRRVDELAAGVREAVAELKEEVGRLREAAAAAVDAPARAGPPRGQQPVADAPAEELHPVVDAPAAAEDPGTRIELDADDELIAEAEAMAARAPEVEAAPEGARLIALKMALDGRPRAETTVYLRENFELDDPETLLDEVYAQAER